MDDAFDSLDYDQEDDGIPLKAKSAISAETSQPNGLSFNPVPDLNPAQRVSNEDELEWSPFDWHMNFEIEEQAAKRRKLEHIENSVASATMRILEARRRRKAQMCTTQPSSDANREAVLPKKVKHLLKYPPVNGIHWFGVSSADSVCRAYLSAKPAKCAARPGTSAFETLEKLGKTGTTSVSRQSEFESLLAEVCSEIEERREPEIEPRAVPVRRPFRRTQMIDESDENLAVPWGGDASELLNCTAESLDETIVQQVPPRQLTGTKSITTALWIDKYAPNNFLDLVTDDEQNRHVLLWLRLWEEYVFHRKQFNYDGLNERDKRFLEVEQVKAAGRIVHMPKHKILMLQGPSGRGKSSLAICAAKQAGYRPFLIAVSEITSIAEFRAKIEDVSDLGAIDLMLKKSNHHTLNIVPKPTCLIIDGIEYGSAEMARFLVKWFHNSREDKKASNLTKRPIICTCNNFYVPSLKELRQNVLLLKISNCSKSFLLKRLQKICADEFIINIGQIELEQLIESCGMDVRLCINTLQFVYTSSNHSEKKTAPSRVNNQQRKLSTVITTKSSRRNPDISIFDTLEAILTLDHHVDNKGMLADVEKRCQNIYELMNHCEDMDRFYSTIFTNLIEVLQLNHQQRRKVMEYFVLGDLNHRIIYQTQAHILNRYQPVIAIALHLCVALYVNKRLVFNLSNMSITERQRECQQIVRTVRSAVMSRTCYWPTFHDLVECLLPLLFYIIQPPIQPMNSQLYGGQDLIIINKVVEIMAFYRITYILTYVDIGTLYCLEPPIDMVTCFRVASSMPSEERIPSATPQKTIKKTLLANNTKKFIAHQIELSNIFRGGALGTDVNRIDDGKSLSNTPQLKDIERKHTQTLSPPSRTPFALKKRKNLSQDFTFKYTTGSSTAIRRNIRIDTLFFR